MSFYNDNYSESIPIFAHLESEERRLITIVDAMFREVASEKYGEVPSEKAIEKLSRLLNASHHMQIMQDAQIHFDRFIDEVITITFPQHHNVKMNICFDNEVSQGEEDVGEAMIISRINGKNELFSGTIESMIAELENIL